MHEVVPQLKPSVLPPQSLVQSTISRLESLFHHHNLKSSNAKVWEWMLEAYLRAGDNSKLRSTFLQMPDFFPHSTHCYELYMLSLDRANNLGDMMYAYCAMVDYKVPRSIQVYHILLRAHATQRQSHTSISDHILTAMIRTDHLMPDALIYCAILSALFVEFSLHRSTGTFRGQVNNVQVMNNVEQLSIRRLTQQTPLETSEALLEAVHHVTATASSHLLTEQIQVIIEHAIEGCCLHGERVLARALATQLIEEYQLHPSPKCYFTLITECANKADVPMANLLLDEMVEHKMPIHTNIRNMLLLATINAGRTEDILQMYEEISSPNEFTFELMMGAFAKAEDPQNLEHVIFSLLMHEKNQQLLHEPACLAAIFSSLGQLPTAAAKLPIILDRVDRKNPAIQHVAVLKALIRALGVTGNFLEIFNILGILRSIRCHPQGKQHPLVYHRGLLSSW